MSSFPYHLSSASSAPPERVIGEERILILAPLGDAFVAGRDLANAGISFEDCSSVEDLCARLDDGAGAVLVTDEALSPAAIRCLGEVLERQPPWSDLPLIVGWTAAQRSRIDLAPLERCANVTLVERPVQTRTLIATVQSALRARRRQYEARELMQKLEQSSRAACEAGRLKDEFLATVSHELRTPLNAVLGWTHLLRVGALGPDQQANAVATIERNAKAQAQLVEDLLDVNRIIGGNLRLEIAAIDPARPIELAIEAVRPAADAKGIRLQSLIEAGGSIMADADRLQQIVWNLLSNAVKFTPHGGHVKVRLRRKGSSAILSILDTGQGIDAAFLPFVFDRFRQADGSATREHGGTGLGLAIVRHLVELHGGTVEARSDGPGRGAAFEVTLPSASGRSKPFDWRSAHATTKPGTTDLPGIDGLRVLVVDDDQDARDLIVSVLEHCNARIETAKSAAEAFEAVQRLRPDVIVSDVKMPTEDGYQLIKRVRALSPDRGGLTPAIALTAYARHEDKARALASGFDLHVPKPIEPAELVGVIGSLAASSSRA